MPTQLQIAEAIKDPAWQKLRRSLLGCSNVTKIARLNTYLTIKHSEQELIQVENYLNALKRGGLISSFRMDGPVITQWEDKRK